MNRAAVLLVLALCSCQTSLVAMGADQITRPLRIPIIGTEPGAKDIEFTTSDHLKLKAWRFDPVGQPIGVIVMVHGRDINRQMFLGRFKHLTDLGFVVVAYDQRAHGASEGEFCTFGKREVDDLKGVIAQTNIAPVVLLGMSLGAAVVLQAAPSEPSVVGVIEASSYADLKSVLEAHKPFVMSDATLALAMAQAEKQADFQIADAVPEKAIARLKVPVLLLHGSEDPFTNVKHAYRLRAAATGPAKLVILEGVEHNDILLHDQGWQVIDDWLKTLKVATSAN